jgi:hypothetical protein
MSFLPSSLQKLSLEGTMDLEGAESRSDSTFDGRKTRSLCIAAASASHLTGLTHLHLEKCVGHIPSLLLALPQLTHLEVVDVGDCFPCGGIGAATDYASVAMARKGQMEFMQASVLFKKM